MNQQSDNLTGLEVAIIGMAIRFPGAETLEKFWQNLSAGVESISHFSDQQLIDAGVDESLIHAENYVKAKGVVDEGMAFENTLFEFSNREAQTMDPQLRIYHECVFQALINAGYDTESYEGLIGIYGGAGSNPFWATQFLMGEQKNMSAQYEAGNLIGKEFFNTRVANKLNLKGPAVTVQTACSSSLVAVHMAVTGLLSGDCDIALAGGVEMSTDSTQKISDINGYAYQEGMIYAADAHCRPFDEKASGTVPGDGAGIVVLKRLEDAIKDGDNICAVIRGSAINNDGSDKAGFTAPSMSGQISVISNALEMAEIDAGSIGYIEAHGTGTSLGDPVEVRALTEAYQSSTGSAELPTGYCRIGSVKSNLGHLGAAAGVAGLIKTTLALLHKKIPPSINYSQPNPEIDFESTPFKVVAQLEDWDTQSVRIAGVSSFGIGGTNAHVIVEEYDRRVDNFNQNESVDEQSKKTNVYCMLLSSTNDESLVKQSKALAEFISQSPDISLQHIAGNLQMGRRHLEHRLAVLGKDRSSIIHGLENIEAENRFLGKASSPKIVFMFPGQGAQYASMGLELYNSCNTFKHYVDQCFKIVDGKNHSDNRILSSLFFGQTGDPSLLDNTQYTQPLMFILEYSLAKYLEEAGIKADVMIGHSLGEYVAATLAGVFDLETALMLVCKRGELMSQTPRGAMLAVTKSRLEIESLLPNGLSIAAENTPASCVVSGDFNLIEEFASQLTADNVNNRLLRTSHGYHSELMEPILTQFREILEQVQFSQPNAPFISNLTGGYISSQEATSVDYWINHLRQKVKFSQGINTLLSNDVRYLFVEVGPGKTLGTFVRSHKESTARCKIVNLLRGHLEAIADEESLTKGLTLMHLAGVKLDWQKIFGVALTKRIPLPGYVFNRKPFYPKDFISHVKAMSTHDGKSNSLDNDNKILKQFTSSWYQTNPLSRFSSLDNPFASISSPSCWLIFAGGESTTSLIAMLKEHNQKVIVVSKGNKYERLSAEQYVVNCAIENDYIVLFEELLRLQAIPDFVLHCWGIDDEIDVLENEEKIDEVLNVSFYSLMSLAKALGTLGIKKNLRLSVISSPIQSITGEEHVSPIKAMSLGAIRVIGQEYKAISTQSIDFGNHHKNVLEQKYWMQLLRDIMSEEFAQFIAYRGNYRWQKRYEQSDNGVSNANNSSQSVSPQSPFTHELKDNGHYLITGGLGGIGLILAEAIAEQVNAKISLISRKRIPERTFWNDEKLLLNDKQVAKIIAQIKLIEASGSQVEIHSADVANYTQMFETVKLAESKNGPVNGVIHAAGVAGGGAIQLKSRSDAERVFKSKVQGTIVLARIFDKTLDFVCLNSSITALFGGFGQIDYCAANVYLDAVAQSGLFNSQRTFSINWDPWKEVGMAVNSLASGDYAISNHELLGTLVNKNNTGCLFKTQMSGKDDWILTEHKLMAKPTAPGSVYLEMARAAFFELTGKREISIEDVYFLMPLVLMEDQWAEVITKINKKGEQYQFSVSSRLFATGETREHARGRLSVLPDEPQTKVDISALIQRCNRQTIDNPRERLAQLKDSANAIESYNAIETGPHWDVFDQLFIGTNEAIARLSLESSLTVELESYLLHPALVDCATAFFSAFVDNALYLPLFYQSVKQIQPLTSQCISHVKLISDTSSESILRENKGNSTLRFDIDLYSPDGILLVAISNFEMKKIVADTPEPIDGIEGEFSEAASGSTNDKKQLKIESQLDVLEDAITNQEGKNAFLSVLSSYHQNIAVTRSNLNLALLESRDNDLLGSSRVEEDLQPRPDLSNAFVAPKSQTEKSLSVIWRNILSMEKVGVNDDFFELGGDSLMLMQVHSNINEQFESNVPIAELYNNQTIKALASYIDGDFVSSEEKIGEKLDQRVEQMKAAKKKRRDRSRAI